MGVEILDLNSPTLRYRSNEGKVQYIRVWNLDGNSFLVNQDGIWQVWSRPMVMDNWFDLEEAARVMELQDRRRMRKDLQDALKKQERIIKKIVRNKV